LDFDQYKKLLVNGLWVEKGKKAKHLTKVMEQWNKEFFPTASHDSASPIGDYADIDEAQAEIDAGSDEDSEDGN